VIADYSAEDNLFLLSTAMHEKDLAKQVPGASWKERMPNAHTGGTGAWVVPVSWPAYVAINGIFAHTLQATGHFKHWAHTVWDKTYGPLTNLRFQQDTNLGDGPTVARLWPLQRVAVQAMVWGERYLEMDEMGGGKTATTLAALKMAVAVHGEAAVFPALIVCPNKVRRSWRKIALEDLGDGHGPLYDGLRLEIMPKGKPAQRKVLEKFTAWDDPENYYRENPADPPPPQVLVTNWESLHLLSRVEGFGQIELTEKDKTPGELNKIPWRTVVADEAHRAKDRRSRQTRALKAIANGTPSVGTAAARFRWALTGTPIASNAAEAWSLLEFIYPEAFPAYTRFIDRYASQLYNGYGGFEIGGVKPETAEEFYAAVLPFSIRRLREQFDPFKPKVSRQTLTVPMEAKQAKAYAELSKTMLTALEGGVLAATDAMSKSNRLFQLSSSHGEMKDKGRKDPITGEPILDLLLTAPSNKVAAMLELVDDFGISSRAAENNGRSIVFGAVSRQLIGLCEEALNKAKIPYTLIAGGMSDNEQERQERNFELGNTRVALCVISAAKEGINSLIRADTLVFLQRSWSRVDNEQFQARIDRPGQQSKAVTIIDVVSEGTLEEFEQVEKLEGKYANFQQVVADARVLHTMLQFKGIQ
jgi:SNF2 family DNA or RNA helicase